MFSMTEIIDFYSINRKKAEREHTLKRARKAFAIIAIASALGGITYDSIANAKFGGNVTDAYTNTEADKIMLDQYARLRFDPFVNDKAEKSNLAEFVEQPVEVTLSSGVEEINKDDGNGTWYGIKTEDLKNAGIDNYNLRHDQDGKVWVSRQKAELEEAK